MLKNECSKPDESMPGWPFDGVPVKRQQGMIYWYSWGDHEFDIRTMRRVLGQPEEIASDKWFAKVRPNACGSFSTIMASLQAAIGDRSFTDCMAEHDRAVDEESDAQQKKLEEWKKIAAKMPSRYKLSDQADLVARVKAGEDLSGIDLTVDCLDDDLLGCPF